MLNQTQYQYVVTYDSYGDGVNDDWGSAPQPTAEEAVKASSVPLGILNARLEFVFPPKNEGETPWTSIYRITDECYYCKTQEYTYADGNVHGFRYPNGHDCMNCNCN